MSYPQSYIDYLVHFHATRDYFECHELLEEYWKTLPKDDPLSDTWVGLIQLAVAQYHFRRSNVAGARKMLSQSLRRLKPEPLSTLGLNGSALVSRTEEMLRAMSEGSGDLPMPSYCDISLPIADPGLLAVCLNRCRELGAEWERETLPEDEELIHRHTRRDRSGVVAARKQSLDSKKRTASLRPDGR